MGSRGRGRGRGQGGTFSMEQLGVQKGEGMPTAVLQPPPVFPPPEYRPLPLSTGPRQEYLISAKRDLRSYMRESPFHIKQRSASNWLSGLVTKIKEDERVRNEDAPMFSSCCWSQFPKELIPVAEGGKARKRKVVKRKKSAVKADGTDILEKLSKLEETGDGGPTVEKEAGSDEETDDEDDENKDKKGMLGIEEEEQVEEVDEEMDGGTDYANNYFDPGDEYADDGDDDNDEGGVY
ncbi:unnamed protein product [Notodromas monacha]|uniref:DNA-directed RNA polymerase III subunit n=1 Tax=Notodromas monacha TaxID=399045 RepID=A0A7R9BMH9_9CRUS|nr:unnamed protein product [Notodromas monacha]CAG0917337.1 unnamed protein product [Notodromas monacha]